MRLADHARRLAHACRIPIRRPVSARSVDLIVADIMRKLHDMEPSTDAQAIIAMVNQLPEAITTQAASKSPRLRRRKTLNAPWISTRSRLPSLPSRRD